MSRFIPVDPEKWAAMVIAQSDLVRYKEICDELDAECTRLKDENARLRSFSTRTIIPNIDLEAENARLKAEVHRLEEIVGSDAIDKKYGMCCDASAQVERLTKAGDELERVLTSKMSSYEVGNASFQWRAAKEGKQP
jgi:hypothetical protein